MDLVKLVRDAKDHPDSHEANVRPEDVGAWEANGWVVAGAGPVSDLDDDSEGLTKREIHADLVAMDVEFDPRAKRADLLALRNEARAKRDTAAPDVVAE